MPSNVERLRRRRADLLRAARAYTGAEYRHYMAANTGVRETERDAMESTAHGIERAAVSYARAAAACEVPRGVCHEERIRRIDAWLANHAAGLSMDNDNDRRILASLLAEARLTVW